MVQQHICRGRQNQFGGSSGGRNVVHSQRTWRHWGIGPGGADGNVGRGTLIGPGLKDMDAALLRNVNIERETTFQFRAEFTNVMNWVSLGNPPPAIIIGQLSGHYHLSCTAASA